MSDPTRTSGNGSGDCYICGQQPATNRAVVETDGVHHASNTLVCDGCQANDRVIG